MYTKCTKCDGEGVVKVYPYRMDPNGNPYHIDLCEFCHGEGIVDWVERILGKGPLSWEQKTEIWRNVENKYRLKCHEKYYETTVHKM
jgi:hypothetical protein